MKVFALLAAVSAIRVRDAFYPGKSDLLDTTMYAGSDSAIDNIGMAGDRIDMSMIESAAGLSDSDFDNSGQDYLTKKSMPEVEAAASTPQVVVPVASPVLAQPDFEHSKQGLVEAHEEKVEAKKSDDKITQALNEAQASVDVTNDPEYKGALAGSVDDDFPDFQSIGKK